MPFSKLKEETVKRRQMFVELLLLDQQLWHACVSDQVRVQQQRQRQRVMLCAAAI